MFQQNIILKWLMAGSFVLGVMSAATAHVSLNTIDMETYSNKVSKDEAYNRLSQINSIIDINVTDEVQERILQYTYQYRSSAEQILGRIQVYFPIFEKEIMRRGMPDDLKYLAVVESLLKPSATSKSGAAGLWQFMKGTGKMLGLEVNSVVDQRRSIELSTQAALDYLQSLYDRFGDWNLAIAAYNCGPGNVNKAIKKSKGKDFWEIRKYLPKETQKYLPRFIAAMYLTNFYQYHGLQPAYYEFDLHNVTTVDVNRDLSLKRLATDMGMVDSKLIKALNPEYIGGYVPGIKGHYTVRIPKRYYDTYMSLYYPAKYRDIVKARNIEKIEKLAEIERLKIQLEIEQQKRDTVTALQEIVSLIYTKLQYAATSYNNVEMQYAIPRKMRARESYSRLQRKASTE